MLPRQVAMYHVIGTPKVMKTTIGSPNFPENGSGRIREVLGFERLQTSSMSWLRKDDGFEEEMLRNLEEVVGDALTQV
ncbi:hypothetical protein ACLB2K_046910 [Fragaria x ananassa]